MQNCLARRERLCLPSPVGTRIPIPSVASGDFPGREPDEHRETIRREQANVTVKTGMRMPGVSGGDSSASWICPSIRGVGVGRMEPIHSPTQNEVKGGGCGRLRCVPLSALFVPLLSVFEYSRSIIIFVALLNLILMEYLLWLKKI